MLLVQLSLFTMSPDESPAFVSIPGFARLADQSRRRRRELNCDLGELRRPLLDRRRTSFKLLVIVDRNIELRGNFVDVETFPLSFLPQHVTEFHDAPPTPSRPPHRRRLRRCRLQR